MKRWITASLALLFYASLLPWTNAEYYNYNTHNITGDNTGRLQNMSIGSASYTDNGYFNYADVNYARFKNGPWADVRAYGAVGDGVTDDTAAIQAAIDAAFALGGGVVSLPPTRTYKAINLILKDGVILIGSPQGIGYLPTNITRTKIIAAGTGIVIDTSVGGATSAGVIGIDIKGLGPSVAVKGIRLRGGGWNHIKNVTVDNTSDEGIAITGGAANTLEDILITNAVMDRTQASIIGAVDIDGTDNYLNRVEATISGSAEGTVQSANLYLIAILIRGSNNFISNSVGEISDIGIYVSGFLNRFVNSRADLNYGHGWYVTGTSNQFSNNLALSNSQDATNTYDNWHATDASSKNYYSNCMSQNLAAKVVRYGFFDNVNSDNSKNMYSNSMSSSSGTAEYYNQGYAGSAFLFPEGPFKSVTDNNATPTVEGYTNFKISNTDNTTITNFLKGVGGQRINLLVSGSGTTTIEHGANIYTNTGSSKALVNNKVYTFINQNGVWYEQ